MRTLLRDHGHVVRQARPSGTLPALLPLADSRAAGLAVAIGTDSANTGGRHDLFEAMRLAMMLPRVSGLEYEAWPRGRDVLDMATRNGATVLGLRETLGRIAPGQLADLVLVRREAASTLALAASESALVQHGGPETVDAVMDDGRWLMRDGRIVAFDEAAAIAAARDAIAGLRERTAAMLGQLRPRSRVCRTGSGALGRRHRRLPRQAREPSVGADWQLVCTRAHGHSQRPMDRPYRAHWLG